MQELNCSPSDLNNMFISESNSIFTNKVNMFVFDLVYMFASAWSAYLPVT